MPANNHTASVPSHYLKARLPANSQRHIIFLGVAANAVKFDDRSEHTLKCWSMIHVDRSGDENEPTISASSYGTNVEYFADRLTKMVNVKETTFVVAYDLSLVATLLQIPNCMTEIGWTIDTFNITSEQVWFKLRKGRTIIVITDVQSYIPEKLDKLAEYAQMNLPLEPQDTNDNESQWRDYCWNVAQIVAVNTLACMDYCDKIGGVKWGITGSSVGWNCLRTHFLTHKILISSDDDARTFERRAIRGGRREVYEVAEWKDGYFADIDIRAAYPTIAANYLLPSKRGAYFDSAPIAWHNDRLPSHGIIARCIVQTDAPLVPARYGTTTFYPMGQFSTVLASPEIDLLVSAGAKVQICEGYRYKLEPILKKWGEWIIAEINPNNDEVLAPAKRMAKHWSRSVIGRWTMRYMREDSSLNIDPDSPPVEQLRLMKWSDDSMFELNGTKLLRSGAEPQSHSEGYVLNLDGKPRAFIRDAEPRDCFPAITAFIESICRVILIKLMSQQPRGTVMQCDTDGYLVAFTRKDVLDAAGVSYFARPDADAIWANEVPIALPKPPEGFELVVKGRYSSVQIRGAQQLRLDGKRRMAGIPLDAVEVSKDHFEAETMPAYVQQLQHGKRGVFVSNTISFASKSTLATGWRLKSGKVMPVKMHYANGVNVIEMPSMSMLTRMPGLIAKNQHPILEKVLGRDGRST